MVNTILILSGAALMVFNIYGFARYARFIKTQDSWTSSNGILYIPIILLVMFLLGYLAVALFGNPDIIMALILFFGSIFVFIMYKYLNSITRKIMDNERLAVKLLAAEESNRAKVSFLANISHEMRTPLNVILGMTTVAMKNDDVPAETRDQLEKIELSAQRMLGLVNNILDMKSIESGSLTTKNEEFSLEELVNQVTVIARALCEEKGLEFKSSIPEQELCHLLGDETQLKNVLMSIFDNAVKYTDVPGTVSFVVENVASSDKKRTIQFTIADTGVGMDSDFVPKVFEAFSQEDDSFTNRYGGGGLSLAVAKNTIELMGGTIKVQSEKNVGSTFTVIVPFVSIAARTKPDSKTESEVEPLETLAGQRVLIVEDLPENAEIVADLLELEDVETEHAENGQVALDMILASSEGYYDAILMDLRMPVMDGLEATRRIRALDRKDSQTIPIIALTANAYETDVKQSLAAGMNVHLAKPADADTLYDTLKQTIAKASKANGNV